MTRRPIADHRDRIAAQLSGLARTETVSVRVALDRVTAEPVHAPYALPLFDNSAMDGFAVRAADVTAGSAMPVADRIFAGDSAPEALAPGTAMAIMTGAPLPAGADAVIPVELATEADGKVRFTEATAPGAFVRPAGDDVTAGDLVVDAGVQLAPRHLGALAASGVSSIAVHRRPTIAVISTGSELILPGTEPTGGQVFESNSLVLQSLSSKHGGQVVFIASARDDDGFETILTSACQDADLVITSGGASMGEREPVRQLLEPHGWFGPIAMQPGGPQGLATWRKTPVCALPGNPVSIVVSFEVLLRDTLREIAGLPPIPAQRATLGTAITSVAGKTQFLRGVIGDDGRVTPLGGPGSHLMVTAAAADLLIEIDADTTQLDAGSEVIVWPLTGN